MTRDQADRVLQASAESEARVLWLSAQPARTPAENAEKATAIADEVARTAIQIREIVLGGPCEVMRTPTTREELIAVLRERTDAANGAHDFEMSVALHPVQWRDISPDIPIFPAPPGPPNRKQRRALARRNPPS
jgi:hypothetical protein